MYGYEHMGMGWGGFWMALLWVLPIVLAVLLTRHFTDRRGTKTPLEILEERYAHGDIDREEFLQRRADLNG